MDLNNLEFTVLCEFARDRSVYVLYRIWYKRERESVCVCVCMCVCVCVCVREREREREYICVLCVCFAMITLAIYISGAFHLQNRQTKVDEKKCLQVMGIRERKE